jgi:hypothetical protein
MILCLPENVVRFEAFYLVHLNGIEETSIQKAAS